ncbi:MAG: hypothetical protein N3D84_00895, partial [Candidatus Woesearchaeota archaeon]|nr:hypothetical protein [Candidatus Woesearchaeota archaeon]
MKKKQYKISVWKISTAVLLLLLLISIFTNGFSFKKELSKEEIKEKTMKYLNDILMGQATATIDDIKDEGNLYHLKLTVAGRQYDSYVTKDGKLLFPSAINMTAPLISEEAQPKAEIPKTEKPDVKLFTMSYCPYGNQAESGIIPVAELLGNKVEIEPHYVIYSNYGGGGPNYCLDSENKYCSMHGINELRQDVRELCIYKYSKEKFWSYINDVNEECNLGNIATCWEGVAKKHNIDTAKIADCEK